MFIQFENFEAYDYMWIYYFLCCMMTAVFRVCLNYFRQESMLCMFLYLTGMGFGYWSQHNSIIEQPCLVHSAFIENYGRMYATLCFFQLPFTIDLVLLRRHLQTILKFCLSAFLTPVMLVLIYFTIATKEDMSKAWAYLMLLIMLSIDKARVCREHRMSNNLILLMDSECFILNVTLMMINSFFFSPTRYVFITVMGILATAIIIGFVTKYVISFLPYDENAAIIVLAASIFITFKVIVTHTYQLAFRMGIVGLILNYHTLNISFEMKNMMLFVLDYTIFSVNATLSISFGIHAGVHLQDIMNWNTFLMALMFYITIICVRLNNHFIVLPLLSPLNFGLSLNHLIIGVFSAFKGNFNIFFIWSEYRDMFGVVIILELITMFVSTIMNLTVIQRLHVNTIPANHLMTITSCLNDTMEKGKIFIASLKINRFFCFVNWELIYELTKITNPYVLLFGDEEQIEHNTRLNEESTNHLETTSLLHTTACGTGFDETENEEELLSNSKFWMLKMKRKSFEYQYNDGKIEQETIVYLRQWVSLAMEKDLSVEDNIFYSWYKKDEYFCKVRNYVLNYCEGNEEKPPLPNAMKYYFWYEMVEHSKFECVFIALNLLFCGLLIVQFVMQSYYTPTKISKIVFVVCHSIFLISFIFELIAKVLANSQTSICKGIRQYFMSHWNKFDFFQLVLLLVSVCVLDVFAFLDIIGMVAHKWIFILNLIRLSASIRYLMTDKMLLVKWVYTIDKQINYKIYENFDLAMACLTAHAEVLNMLEFEIKNVNVRKKIRNYIECRRQLVLEELILIESERPWVALTVKNQQVARITIVNMSNTIKQLQTEGWLEPSEVELLKDSCLACTIYSQKMFSVVPTRAPLRILKQNSCFNDVPPEIVHYLVTNSTLKRYKTDEIFVSEGERLEGVFLITSGSLKQSYKYRDATKWQTSGLLPVVEMLNMGYYKHDRTEYFSTGFWVGFLGFLTGRPVDCDIVASSPTEGYFIPNFVMQHMLDDTKLAVECLFTKLWLFATNNVVIPILLNTNYYHQWSQAQLRRLYQRVFIPKMDSVKTFFVNNLVEDMILLEGIVTDEDRKTQFIGPCYIPRSVRQLILVPPELSEAEASNRTLILMVIHVVNVRPLHLKVDKLGNSTLNTLRYQSCLRHLANEQSTGTKNAKAISHLHFLKNLKHKTASFRSSEDFDSANMEDKHMLDAELNRVVAETDTLLTPMSSIIPELKQYMATSGQSSGSGSTTKRSEQGLKMSISYSYSLSENQSEQTKSKKDVSKK